MASTLYRSTLSLAPGCYNAPQPMPSTISLFPPYVFVVPPYEDDEDPWLCFDPNDPLSDPFDYEVAYSSPDTDEFPSPYDQGYSPADPHAGVTFPSCPGESTRVIVEALLSQAASDADFGDEDRSDTPQGRRTIIHPREPGNDSEVVEVVKVRRSSEDSKDAVQPTRKQRSNSFISRAFRSISNLTKSSKSPVVPEKQLSKASAVAESPTEALKRPKLLRRRTSSRPSSIRSSATSDLMSPSRTSFATTSDVDEEQDAGRRPSSPSPSAHTTRTTKSSFGGRRFSVLSLNRLFSSASQCELPQANEMGQSRESIGPSTESSASSSSVPSTPVNGTFALPSSTVGKPEQEEVQPDNYEENVEMRLDSLHFDSLSFDANEFH